MTALRRSAPAVLLVAALAMAACANPEGISVQPDAVRLPTPLRSFDASVGAALATVEQAVAAAGERLEVPARPYRPSEPPSLLEAPRVVRRAALADPDDGWVMLYVLADPEAADARARELADYLASGFGQTNYAADTQFAVSTLDDTVVFTTWSPRRSDDPQRAEAVFDAVAGVGEPVEVSK